MPPEPPSTLGAYPIERELGRGGMGVVYLARDPKLNRDVAIKVVPDHLAGDPEHLARFRREATLLASVNHPNIASVHGVEDIETASGERQLLVLEYVPGETLADRLARGPLPLDDALEVGRQIAAGLEAAHERGVIHRDLKPANIRITPDDQVKVLDFGLARGETGGSNADVGDSPTLTYSPTGIGVILGTAGYMSPEQARGRTLDRRTDVWAFGCVLFECLTGRRTFDGETATDIVARILEREPDWTLLPADTPPALRALLRRCLERNPKKRQRDLGDVALVLEEIAEAHRLGPTRGDPPAGDAPRVSAAAGWRAARAGLLLAAGAIAGAAVWATVGSAPSRPSSGTAIVRLEIDLPADLRMVLAPDVAPFAITPDGRHVLFIARGPAPDDPEGRHYRVYQRSLDQLEVLAVPGTDSVKAFAVSPDSRWLAFSGWVSEDASDMHTMKVPLDGSTPPVRLGDWDDSWGESLLWLPDGDLLAIEEESGTLYRMPNTGGAWREAGLLDTGDVTGYPQLARTLPDGQSVMMAMQSWGESGFRFDQWVLDPDTGHATRILEDAGRAVFTDSGHVVFSRGETLMAAEFDRESLQVTGEVQALADGLRTASSWSPGEFVLARDGTLLLVPGVRAGIDRRLVTVEPDGTIEPYSDDVRAYEQAPDASADGSRVAVVVSNNSGTWETWIADRGRPGLTRAAALTSADAAEPRLSPDGTRLAFSRTARDPDDGVYLTRPGMNEAPRLLLGVATPEEQLQTADWLPDGSGLLVWKADSAGGSDIVLVPLDADDQRGEPIDVVATEAFEHNARMSPDGNLLAWVSDETGRPEAYVAQWLGGGRLGPALRVSDGIVGAIDWSGPEDFYYYLQGGQVMTVSVTSGATLSTTPPREAWDLDELRVHWDRWSMMPDGRLLAMQNGESEASVRQLHVVLNWFEELRSHMAGR